MIFNKKAQEEIVGFVLIIILVAIIAVVFLGFSLRNDNRIQVQESEELNSFISSLSYFTTDCEIPETNFKTIGSLISQCYTGGRCADSRLTCTVLRDTLISIMDNSTYIVGQGSNVYYYELKVYSGDFEENIVIEDIEKVVEGGEIGVCRGNKIYNEKDFSTLGSELLHLRFEVCYS